MKRILLLTLFLLTGTISFAQSLKQDIISISVMPKYNFNKANIVNDDFISSYITANNNTTTSFGISYRHITKRGFIIGYGIDIGKEIHQLHTVYDLTGHDPRSTLYDHSTPFSVDYKFVSIQITQKLMIGYTMPLPIKGNKGWHLEGRVGIALKGIPKYADSVDRYRRFYVTDSGKVVDAAITNSLITLGTTNKPSLKSSNNTYVHMWEVYIGLRKDMNLGIIKTMNIGLEFAHNLVPKTDIYNKVNYSSYNFTPDNNYTIQQTNIDNYYNRSISLGLRVSMGL